MCVKTQMPQTAGCVADAVVLGLSEKKMHAVGELIYNLSHLFFPVPIFTPSQIKKKKKCIWHS